MAQNVMITGTGKSVGLGFNLVLTYLEAGDTVVATVRKQCDELDTLINNAVSVSPDCDKGFFDANLDYIAKTVDITAVGAMRVIKAFYPFLKKSDRVALVMNISSEAGSISKCFRTNMIDYGMAKAALNMATMNLVNTFKDDKGINFFCVHPGWIRTDGREDNPAPLSSYEAAVILRELFEAHHRLTFPAGLCPLQYHRRY